MQTFRALEPATQKNLAMLFITGLSFWLSMTCLLPVLPAYIQDLGGSKQEVGLVMGSFAIGLLCSRTLVGRLADERSRKSVVLIGVVVATLAPIGYMLVKSIPCLMVMRAFHGISISAFTTGYSVLVVDLSPPKQRGELIGYMSLAIPIGMTIGPALGGYLQTGPGYDTVFTLSAIASGLAILLSTQIKEKSLQEKQAQALHEPEHLNRNFWELFASWSFIVPGLILLLIGSLFGTLATFLPLFVRESAIDFNAGLYYTIAAIASFMVRIYTGKASDVLGRGLFITGSICCYAMAMVLLAFAREPILCIFSAILEGIGSGILIPMLIALMSDRSYPSERGKVYSICNSGFDVGVAIAGPILGALASTISYHTMFGIAASFGAIALFIFLTLSNKNAIDSCRFAFGRTKDYYAVE